MQLLDYLIDENNIDFIERKDINFVGSLIKGDTKKSPEEGKKWMYEIIANKTNSLDVDKLDYLNRDSKHLGISTLSFDHDRIIKESRIIKNQLCFKEKIYYDIESVFKTRYNLFKECYSHRVCRAIDYMIVDALLLANPVYHFEEKIFNPAEYVDVTDNVL